MGSQISIRPGGGSRGTSDIDMNLDIFSTIIPYKKLKKTRGTLITLESVNSAIPQVIIKMGIETSMEGIT